VRLVEAAYALRTVANQLAAVYRKHGVTSRSELAAAWTSRER
jgi:DNA-binding CsgD family transcriptional regulator